MRLRQQIERALKLEFPYFDCTLENKGTLAAVLLFVSHDEHLLLTKRTESVETHKGQIAFPGGRMDLGETDPRVTATREALEEVGLESSHIDIVGELPLLPVYASSHLIHPVVAIGKSKSHEMELTAQVSETAEIFWVPLEFFLSERTYRTEEREWKGHAYTTHVYQWNQHEIWGATAIMIKNFCDRIQKASNI
ncbi:MAG: CoA pyrophosphatase [Xanthomonadaceae bacterium]|nr:CoA pyrophosphatase [Xanthomonadaceae bacterium]